MANSVRETIIATVVSTLSAGTPPATVSRSNQFQRNDANASLPAIVVYPLEEKVLEQTFETVYKVLTVAVECQVKGAPPIDQAIDPLFQWAIQKLLADDTLGGLAEWIQEASTLWNFDSVDEDVCGARITFDIRYSSNRKDPTQASQG